MAPNEIEVRLISYRVWNQIVEQSFKDLSKNGRILAEAALTTAHNRHIGLPAETIASLAPILCNEQKQINAPAPWDDILRRLRKEILPDTKTERTNLSPLQLPARSGFVLARAPLCFVTKMVLPLIALACQDLGLTLLFCDDKVDNGATRNQYDDYRVQVERKLITFTRPEETRLELFWKTWAATLMSQTANEAHTLWNYPELDESSAAFLYRLDEEVKPPKEMNTVRRLTTPVQRQTSRAQKEEGVTGVRMTHNLEELSSILLSELAYPKEILMDRLVNTGFLILERQPKREKMRHALIVGMMPWQVRCTSSGGFAQACWFSAMQTLGYILLQHRLHNSEFRWIEGDGIGRMRSSSFLLNRLAHWPVFHSLPQKSVTPLFHHEFIHRLRWLPTYIDRHAHFQTLDLEDPADETENGLKNWIHTAWRQQIDAPDWQPQAVAHTPVKPHSLAIDDYAYVHVMVFCPARLIEINAHRVANWLQMSQSNGHHASLTWTPEQPGMRPQSENRDPEREKDWGFSGHLAQSQSFSGELSEAGLRQLFRKLQEDWWLKQIIAEVARG